MNTALDNPAITVREIVGRQHMLAQHPFIQLLNLRLSQERHERRLTHMLANGYRMVGAFAGDACLGLSGFWINSKLYSGKCTEADNFVAPGGYRSAGVGKRAGDWMEEESQRLPCDTVMLDAYVTDSAAHRFYFREVYPIKSYQLFKSL